MKNNISGNTTFIAIGISLLVGSLAFYSLYGGFDFNKNISNSKLSLNSQINIIGKTIENDEKYGDTTINTGTTVLDENKEVNIKIPKKDIDGILNVSFSGGIQDSFLGIKIAKGLNNDFKINEIFNTEGGFIIQDTSNWNQNDIINNIKLQKDYIKNNQNDLLKNFIKNELLKIGKVGSYIVLDLGDTKYINNFSLKLTDNNKNIVPEMLSLTFDNGISYYYRTNIIKEKQGFVFEETKTRFIKLDILKTSNGVLNNSNINVSNNLSRNINTNDINYIKNTDNYTFYLDNLDDIIGLKFYNVYLTLNGKKSNNPIFSKTFNERSFFYKNKNNELINEIGIEICSDVGKCNNIIYKVIN